MSKPVPSGSEIALRLFIGIAAITNRVGVTYEIYDSETKIYIWNDSQKIFASIGSSAEGIINVILENAGRKLPYKS